MESISVTCPRLMGANMSGLQTDGEIECESAHDYWQFRAIMARADKLSSDREKIWVFAAKILPVIWLPRCCLGLDNNMTTESRETSLASAGLGIPSYSTGIALFDLRVCVALVAVPYAQIVQGEAAIVSLFDA